MNWIPINSLITDDGDLVSLASLRGTLRAQPIQLDEGTAIGDVRVSSQTLSISVAGKLGVGSIFAASVQGNEFGFWLDAMASADSAPVSKPESVVSQTRWGYGLRILFRARQLDTSVKLNLAILGAAVELGLASASYEVQTIGLGPMALGAILDGISQFGTLRGDTYHDLNTTVIGNISKLIKDHAAEFVPRPIAVQLRIPVEQDPIPKAHTEVFAMRRVREGLSIKDAVARAGGKYDENVIRAVYRKIAPGLQDTKPPSESAKDKAKQWLG
ncbi:MAG: hypothetical protein QOF62_2139 [Pyrinomonadaceae bacterium]|jgi:hypothetical protein|nr:hypothetical protein [Pyrinomonadaceae bacterium]